MIAILFAVAVASAQSRQPMGPVVGWTTHGPYGGFVSLTVDPGTPSTLFAEGATDFRSTDAATTWEGVEIPGQLLTISPSDPRVRYTTGYRSVDGGLTWTRLAPPVAPDPSGHVYYPPSALAVDPMHPDTVYLGISTILVSDFGPHQEQIFKSTDGGMSWVLIFSLGEPYIESGNVDLGGFLVEPADSSALHMVIHTYQPATQTILNSSDGGLTWAPAIIGVPQGISNLAAGSAGILFAGTSGGGVFHSLDAGMTWSPANGGLPADALAHATIVVAPSDPSILYASTSAGIFRSDDAASSWSSTGAAFVEGSLVVDPLHPSRVYYSGQHDEVFKSIDAGTTWVRADAGLMAMMVDDLAVDPFNSSVLFAAVRGGVVKSMDRGLHWSIHSSGLPPSPFGYDVVMDPRDSGVLYLATSFSGVFRSEDSAESWTAANNGLPPDHLLGVTLALDSSNPDVLLAGTEVGVFKTQNGGLLWQPSNSGILEGLGVFGLAIDGPLAFAETALGVYRSADAGATWSPTSIMESASPILIDPRDSSHVFAATRSGVLESLDAGLSWTLTGLTEETHSIVLDAVAGALFAVTTERILRSVDDGRTWAIVDRGLGPAVIAVDSSGPTLYAAKNGVVYALETARPRTPSRGGSEQGSAQPPLR